jgi:hypothetical protein
MRASVAGLVLLAAGCSFPRRVAELPPRDEAWIAVLSGEMPDPISDVARHAWIVASIPPKKSLLRWELGSGGHHEDNQPFHWFGDRDADVAIHGIVRGDRAHIAELAACLDRSTMGYRERHPTYWPIPGPNSNTIVAEALRTCGIHVELPATAIGRDYLGIAGANVTESGTGVQLETWPAGVRIGLQEGVEAHFIGLPIGVHTWPPGITVPINPAGRIGLDLDMHATDEQRGANRQRRSQHDEEDETEPNREYGLGVAQLFIRGAHVRRPEDAGGLHERFTLGMSGRAIYAKEAGYAFGLDVEVGAGVPLGFAYGIYVYPAGGAVLIGNTGFLGVFAGLGVSGVSARVPGALELPVEARLELDASRRARVGLRMATTWIPGSTEREGASVLSWADELTLGAFARIGPTRRSGSQITGHGFFFGLERREIMRTYWLGLVIGRELDAGG